MTGLGYLVGGSTKSFSTAVSGNGTVIVGRSQSSNGLEAFRWTQATGMVGLGDLAGGAFASAAKGVSDDGNVIIGEGFTSPLGQEAFVWDSVNGMRNLRELLIDNGINMAGWQLQSATSISADGTSILGFGTNPSGQFEAWKAQIASIPEPSSYLLVVGVAAGATIVVMRKRRKPCRAISVEIEHSHVFVPAVR